MLACRSQLALRGTSDEFFLTRLSLSPIRGTKRLTESLTVIKEMCMPRLTALYECHQYLPLLSFSIPSSVSVDPYVAIPCYWLDAHTESMLDSADSSPIELASTSEGNEIEENETIGLSFAARCWIAAICLFVSTIRTAKQHRRPFAGRFLRFKSIARPVVRIS